MSRPPNGRERRKAPVQEFRLTTYRAHTIAARLGLWTALSLFGLIVIGSLVRSTGSGLSCPDWPLCQGRLIPSFDLHVMIEWLHRTVALATSLLLFATALWTVSRRELRESIGGLVALAVLLLLVQVLLGALTVWKLLSPAIVSSHLAVALLLFCAVLAVTLVAESRADDTALAGSAARRPRPALLMPSLVIVTTLAYAQAVLGGVVSSQHAGLACPDWPTCNGRWFAPLEGLAGIQILHRLGAYLVTIANGFAFVQARQADDLGVRAGASMAFGLNLAQLVLGVCNVLLGTPPWLSALHIATAAAMIGLLVTVTYRAAALPARETRLARVEAT